MNTVWNDIRYAIRGFRRTPLFTSVAIDPTQALRYE